MRLISWNVNGLRACLAKNFGDFFASVDADIFCVQESKMQPHQADIAFSGYESYWNSAEKKGYSGVVIFTRIPPLRVTHGIEIARHDSEGRVLCAEFLEFFLVNVYTPNSQAELKRLPYRMDWDDAFRAYVSDLARQKPVVICGDLNVAHNEIDLKNPKSNRRNAGFSDEEREKFSALLGSGFIDTYRHFFPDRAGAYTWWSYMGNARANNSGWRIDYFLVSKSLRDRLKSAEIFPEIMGSDHCPVGITLDFD